MAKPRLPWKRGPAAWHVKCRSDQILAQLAVTTRPFLTLRAAARLFGLSTQPLRDWLARGYLRRTGPRLCPPPIFLNPLLTSPPHRLMPASLK